MKHNYTFKAMLLMAVMWIVPALSWSLETDENGIYQISTGEELFLFSQFVNTDNGNASAVLTADIDMTGFMDQWSPIGTGIEYAGTFDGQNHQITGFDYVATSGNGGLFGTVRSATIQNFQIYGSLVCAGAQNGVVAVSYGATIRNVHSYLVIDATASGITHTGGVAGGARTGTLLERCSFSGTLTVGPDNHDCFGGVTGYTNEYTTVQSCANYGTVVFSKINCYVGGIVGYVNNGSFNGVRNSINVGKVVFDSEDAYPDYGGAIVGRLRDHNLSLFADNYWLEGSAYAGCGEQDPAEKVYMVTAEEMASGKITYLLNGDQSQMIWTQDLGKDECPVLFPAHQAILAVPSGGFRCDGTPLGDVTYINGTEPPSTPPHTFVSGICEVCGNVQPDYLMPNDLGFYELGDAQAVVWFANLVSFYKEGGLNAVLASDINMTDADNARFVPIGNSVTPFTGTFDGQNHKITGFNMVAKAGSSGFIGYSQNGTIQNFSIEGELVCSAAINGAIAFAKDEYIYNVHSSLNILVPSNASVTHTAGVVGDCQENSLVSHCTFSGVLTVEAGNDCFGGVVGYTNNARVEYCANYGSVFFASKGCYAGGIVAYINSGNNRGISNCLNVGEVTFTGGDEPDYGGAIVGRLRSYSESAMGNNYWVEGSAFRGTGESNSPKSKMITLDQLTDGEACWLLNNETFLDAQWFQTLGQDSYPVLDNTSGLVYGFGGNYGYVQNGDVTGLRDALVASESAMLDELKAQKALKDFYSEQIQKIAGISTYEELTVAYLDLMDTKSVLMENADAYQAFIDKVNETIDMLDNHPEIVCDERDILEDYLYGSDEPSELYPNGQSQYIYENEQLNTEDIKGEIARIDAMLDAAISNSLNPGSDVTRFVKNPDFRQVVEGWAGSTPTNYGGNEEIGYALLSNGKVFDLYQTITGLQNGYYLLSVNALYRPARGSDTSTDYAGFIYANDNQNYIMAACEDVVSEADAIDGENCYMENDVMLFDPYGEALGYTPGSGMGMAIAIRAGRYDDNKIVALVTDGTLTIGVRNDGTCAGNDWLEYGNIRLTYAGAENNGAAALEYLKIALASQSARAQKLIESFGDVGDYAHDPNFSQELRTALIQTVEKAGAVTTAEEAYATVKEFSNLFQSILECKRAYVSLLKAAESFYAAVYDDEAGFSEEEMTEAYNVFEAVVEKWRNGEYTTDEAWAQDELANSALFQRVFGETPDVVDGVYQISDAQQIQWLVGMVNSGNNGVKACLTADIDLTPIMEQFKPIGTPTYPFTGIFDGQNHTITGFAYEGNGDNNGFFGQVLNGTVKNFKIEGTLKAAGSYNGAIAWTQGAYIINVHSALVIDATQGTTHHVAGVVGSLRTSSTMERCSFSGTLTVGSSSNDCFGGVAGYSNEYVSISHCVNYGKILYGNADCYCGGILGYLNNSNFYGIHASLNVGEVTYTGNGNSNYGGAIVGRLRDHNPSNFGTNYWLEGSSVRPIGERELPEAAVSVTADQLASGEICYLLNDGESQPVWYQTLGSDAYPVLDDTHKKVIKVGEGQYTNGDPSDLPDGSKERPFVVKNANDMANLINLLVSGRMNYVVMEDDIDMAGITDWKPLFDIADQSKGYPYIDFDGQNHVIRNFTSNNPDQWYNGIFGVLCGNVRNLGVENANVECQASGTGIISGYLGHSTYGKPCYVENVWVTGKVSVTQGYCGGMFGNIADESHILNCYANVEVVGAHDYTGGIIGRVRGRVDMVQCYAAGSINRGGGIIGGGFLDDTPQGTYKHVAVWNNTEQNFGPARENEDLRMILYYDGTNFADLQSQVVAWDPEVWYCDMADGSYPVLKPFANGITSVRPALSNTIYDLQGRKLERISQKGIYIMNGKQILVK